MTDTKFNLVALVDDNSATNFYHTKVIENSGISGRVKEFTMAQDALEYLKNGENEMPEIIFVDINMPRISGWEFVEMFGQIQMENRPPVVLMSSTVDERDMKKAQEHPLIYTILCKSLTVGNLQQLHAEFKA